MKHLEYPHNFLSIYYMDSLYDIYLWIMENYIQISLLFLVVIIIVVIEKLNNYYNLLYGVTSTLPLMAQTTNIIKIGKKKKNNKH